MFTLEQLMSHTRLFKDMMSLILIQCCSWSQVLYNHGARKIALVGSAPLGCIPINLALNSADGTKCLESDNRASQMYSKRLKASVDVFNTKFPDAQFIYLDGYWPIFDVISNAAAYG